jgi:hypothetical protein
LTKNALEIPLTVQCGKPADTRKFHLHTQFTLDALTTCNIHFMPGDIELALAAPTTCDVTLRGKEGIHLAEKKSRAVRAFEA